MTKPGIGRGVGIGGLLLLLGAIFWLSVLERQPRFGDLQGRGHEWLTGSAVKFTRNWFREGAWNLRFAMLENPRSIEFPDLRSRQPYVSYPVGCLLPVYATSMLTRREPSPALVMSVNLASHFIGALAIFAIIALALEELGLAASARVSFALLGFLFYVFLPGPFYWFQNVYFSDQAIVPIALMAVLLEILDQRSGHSRWEIAQSLVVGWGVFTDWFMVPVAAALLVSKLTTGRRPLDLRAELARATRFLLPSALAVALFAIQVASLDGFASLKHKLLNRTGLTPGTPFHFSQLYDRFWMTYVPGNFGGDLAPWLLAASAVALLALSLGGRTRRGQRDPGAARVIEWSWLLLVPPIVHCLVFWQHSVDHSFTPLRFLPAFVCLPFVFLPLLLARRVGLEGWGRAILAVGLLSVGLLYLAGGRHRLDALERGRRPEIPAIGISLGHLARYEDVLFSPDFDVPTNPPELLSYSMKRVYPLGVPDSLAAAIAALPAQARIRMVFLQQPPPEWHILLQGARREDAGVLRSYDLGLVTDLRPEQVAHPRQ